MGVNVAHKRCVAASTGCFCEAQCCFDETTACSVTHTERSAPEAFRLVATSFETNRSSDDSETGTIPTHRLKLVLRGGFPRGSAIVIKTLLPDSPKSSPGDEVCGGESRSSHRRLVSPG